MKKLFLVGKLIDYEVCSWQFAGVYSEQSDAEKACISDKYFVAVVCLDQSVPDETIEFKDAWYPKLESREESYHSKFVKDAGLKCQ